MKRLTVTLSYGWFVVSLVACQVWLPDERSGLGVIDSKPNNLFLGKTVETTISVPLDPSDPGNGTFDLYYFVRMPSSGKAPKTVLFCAGGPGVFIGPTTINLYTDFLINNGYNVIHYHPRGAGFSQIPAQNKYDRFLTTSYVVQDIEAIRKHFLGPTQKWDAVIGYSFGTVVAQYYAGEYKSNLERLILIGTQSRHAFQTLPDPFDQITNEILNINRITLTNIFQRTEFSNTVSPDYLSPQQKSSFIDTAFGPNGVYKRAEEKFGSLPFVISAYCELKANNKLAANNLNYSQQFFTALRGLRFVGWSPQSQDQVDFGKDIANELKGTVSSDPDCGRDPTGSSDRVFYSVSFFDGINTKFLSKWLANGKTGVQDAVRASAGEIHYTFGGINKFVDKVGISNTETIEPWDPAKHYTPEIPTLILRGSADTVPVGGASEYIFLNALAGPRALIKFPGIGHFYILPAIPSNFSSTSPACSPSRSIRNCLIYSFLMMSPTDFKNPTINGILPVITNLGTDPTTGTNLNASICYRDQSLAQTLVVFGTCP